MIKLYTWNTPNGRKVSIALEEMQLDYSCIGIDIGSDEPRLPEFLSASANNKIPAITDGDLSLFESGAILMYLARKSGKFLATEGSSQYWQTMQWLMWQKAGYGPMLGQTHHFVHFNPGKSEYAEKRFGSEAHRLTKVLDTHLATSEYLVDELSIADFAIWPWTSRFDFQKIDLSDYPNVKRWYLQLAERPGFVRGYAKPDNVGPIPMP